MLTLLALLLAINDNPQPTADEIVARYIAARGGQQKIDAIRTLIYRGVYREGGYESPNAAMALMRPYYKLVGDPDRPSADFAEGYDGSTWEFIGDPGVVIRTVGAASAAGRHATNIGGPLVDDRQRGWSVTLQGVETVGDRKAYRLRVRLSDGFEQDELIDAETWLLIAERKVAPIHAFGRAVASEERIGDYREVAGVLFPYSHKETEIATGRVLNEMQWTSITANRELDVRAFSPPRFERTPLQQFLEQLFEERADPAAVLWSYRDFRRAHPDADTHAGIEFAGYQMVKAGEVKSAVALLEADEADYPRAATAAFGLGRAYKAAGELAKARDAFRRALAIDPKYQRAADALRETE